MKIFNMKVKFLIIILITLCFNFNACKKNTNTTNMNSKKYHFDLQGHRGARGLLPENTLSAFQKAIDIGVNTLELDVVISKDSLVVVSHEAYMNPKICLDPKGNRIADKSAYNLYDMNYKDIKAFDCGSLPHPDFPNQRQKESYKPLLSEVIELAKPSLTNEGSMLNMNIELKSLSETDEVYHPKPDVFIDLVVKIIKEGAIPLHTITLQSFDKRIVRQVAKTYPEISVAYLVEDGSMDFNLKELGIKPHIYSPYYKLLDNKQIEKAHQEDIKIIPWTVNDKEDMQRLLDMGVDGIITDYPNLAKPFHLVQME